MDSPKGLAFISIVLLFGTVFLLYFFSDYKPKKEADLTLPTNFGSPPPTPTNIPFPTFSASASATWRVYSNKKYPFTFKYPRNWIVSTTAVGIRLEKPSPKGTSESAKTIISLDVVDEPFEKSEANFKDKQVSETLAISDITVASISGYYYQIKVDGPNNSTNVVLPYENRKKTLLLGVTPRTDTTVFHQLLSTITIQKSEELSVTPKVSSSSAKPTKKL